MSKTKNSRRENFEVTPEQQAEIEALQSLLDAPSKKDAVLTAVRLALHLAAETRQGHQVFVGAPDQLDLRRVLMVGIEKPSVWKWRYLVERPHKWKRQLHVKGRKLPAAVVWNSMLAEKRTVEETADAWELPIEAVHEIIQYCEANKDFLEMESVEELHLLKERGFPIDPEAFSG